VVYKENIAAQVLFATGGNGVKVKSLFNKRSVLLVLALVFCACFVWGCKSSEPAQVNNNADQAGEKVLVMTGDGLGKASQLTRAEMIKLPDAQFEHVYSIINNYPTKKKYAARGVKLSALLKAAGIKDEAKCIAVIGDDGYKSLFTREQLLETKRYYFPGVLEGDPAGAEPVEPIIAYEYAENSDQLSEVRADDLCLLIPQANVKEQTQHAFVKGIKEIIVSVEDPEKWAAAAVFPQAGLIARGDTVKLQHKELGKVKMYYTLDGSAPTEQSTLYNPSTHQTELTKPIVIEKDTTIKVLVKGFGKYDSEVAEFRYQVK
jgi:hypothetical protein